MELVNIGYELLPALALFFDDSGNKVGHVHVFLFDEAFFAEESVLWLSIGRTLLVKADAGALVFSMIFTDWQLLLLLERHLRHHYKYYISQI